jgi:hypothetical protein
LSCDNRTLYNIKAVEVAVVKNTNNGEKSIKAIEVARLFLAGDAKAIITDKGGVIIFYY